MAELLTIIGFFLAAVLYASVGHAGASGYIAVMAFANIDPAVMKTSALIMNLFVATIAFVQFYRAGFFSFRLFWPFAVGSIPLSFVGGTIQLHNNHFKILAAVVLFVSAGKLFFEALKKTDGKHTDVKQPELLPSFFSGGIIGLFSGLTGTGGGIFLSPLLLFKNWGETKDSAGVSAAFILVNSISGLAGLYTKGLTSDHNIVLWCIVVTVGGLLGATYGSQKASAKIFRFALGIVLVVAGIKLCL